MRWTNDRWKSTRHRVLNPPRAAEGRLSFCHFIEPNYDALIECLPTCSGPEQPAKYPPIAAGDYMLEKFASQASGEEWSDEDSRKFGTADTETALRRVTTSYRAAGPRSLTIEFDYVSLGKTARPVRRLALPDFGLDVARSGWVGMSRRTRLPSRAVVPFPTIQVCVETQELAIART